MGLRLGQTLQDMVLGEQPRGPVFTPPYSTPPIAPTPTPVAAPTQRSRGQMIAGILSDAVKGFLGQPGTFGATLAVERQRQQDMEAAEAQWSRRRQAENQDWIARQQYERANPATPAILRDVQAWQGMTPDQKAAYEAMKRAQEGDPVVNVTLPNGQFYSGPRSGLTGVLSGGQAPARPVGNLTPIDGGPGGSPSGARFPAR